MPSPPSALAVDHLHALYHDHHGWLLHWLRRRMAADEAAADLAQDTFLRVLQKPEIPVLHEPRAYLTRIANGLVINLWQRRALERAYLEVLAVLPEPLSPSQEQRQLALESLLRIDALLNTLPKRARESFLLSQLDGMKYAQIAALQGITERTVKRDVAKAMAACLIGLE